MSSPFIFRALDAINKDWVWGQGMASYFTQQQALDANIQTALQCWVNDCFWNLTFGVDWTNLLGQRNTQNAILLQTRAVLGSCYGVVKINSVSSVLNRATRQMSVTYNITTIFSQSVINSVSIPTS